MTAVYEFKDVAGSNLPTHVSFRGKIWRRRQRHGVGRDQGSQNTDLIFIQGSLNAQGYIDQVLRPVAVPFINAHGPATLMHDNARPHTVRPTQQFLNGNRVNILPWPSLLPDLNPIEHIWDALGHRVRSRHVVNNLHDLRNALLLKSSSKRNTAFRKLNETAYCAGGWTEWLTHTILMYFASILIEIQ